MKILGFILSVILLSIAGCATTTPIHTIAQKGAPGIYHRVEKGQTLWQISKLYNLDLDELARVNRITDATNIEIGQLVFIPYRQKEEPVIDRPKELDDFIWPIKGKIIASYGQNYQNMINKGLNIQPQQENNVVASRSGRVIFYADSFEDFGKTIIIEHNEGYLTVYTGNSEVLVKPGDKVSKGTIIARIGPGSYLHFEIRKGHIPQNPLFYLSR